MAAQDSVFLYDAAGNPITSEAYSSQRALHMVVGDGPQRDGFGRIRVADTELVESLHFSNTNHPLLVNTAVTGSAATAFNANTSSLRITNTTGSSDTAIVQTKRYFRYNPGRSYVVTLSGNMGAKKANVTQRWGYFDANNGLFFEQTNSGLVLKVRTNSSGSPVDTSVAQSAWNLDKLDGTGPSGINLNTALHNLYVIDFLWHGAGRIRFGILFNGAIVYCHQINAANVSATPFMRSPSLPLRVELNNTAGTASTTTLDLVCFAFQKEASDSLSAPYTFSTATAARSPTSVGATLIPLLSIRPRATFNSLTNRIPIIPSEVQVTTQQVAVYASIVLNATLTGASFAAVQTNSATEVDIAATALSGGTVVRSFFIPASSSLGSVVSADVVSALELLSLGLDIAGSVQDTLTVACQSTGGGSNTWATANWEEYQ